MKFSAEREHLLVALQSVIGVVERRQTMPILVNLLLSAKQGKLSITATDLEVELVAQAEIKSSTDGQITLPGRKLLDAGLAGDLRCRKTSSALGRARRRKTRRFLERGR